MKKDSEGEGRIVIDFCEVTNEAHLKVAKWPEWKQNVKITKYSSNFKDESKDQTKDPAKNE